MRDVKKLMNSFRSNTPRTSILAFLACAVKLFLKVMSSFRLYKKTEVLFLVEAEEM